MKTIYTTIDRKPIKIEISDEQVDLIHRAIRQTEREILVGEEDSDFHPKVEIDLAKDDEKVVLKCEVSERGIEILKRGHITRYESPEDIGWSYGQVLRLSRDDFTQAPDVHFDRSFLSQFENVEDLRWLRINPPWSIIDENHVEILAPSLKEHFARITPGLEGSYDLHSRSKLDVAKRIGSLCDEIIIGTRKPNEFVGMCQKEFAVGRGAERK